MRALRRCGCPVSMRKWREAPGHAVACLHARRLARRRQPHLSGFPRLLGDWRLVEEACLACRLMLTPSKASALTQTGLKKQAVARQLDVCCSGGRHFHQRAQLCSSPDRRFWARRLCLDQCPGCRCPNCCPRGECRDEDLALPADPLLLCLPAQSRESPVSPLAFPGASRESSGRRRARVYSWTGRFDSTPGKLAPRP